MHCICFLVIIMSFVFVCIVFFFQCVFNCFYVYMWFVVVSKNVSCVYFFMFLLFFLLLYMCYSCLCSGCLLMLVVLLSMLTVHLYAGGLLCRRFDSVCRAAFALLCSSMNLVSIWFDHHLPEFVNASKDINNSPALKKRQQRNTVSIQESEPPAQ